MFLVLKLQYLSLQNFLLMFIVCPEVVIRKSKVSKPPTITEAGSHCTYISHPFQQF